jgi:hypothetical protein
VTQGQQQQTHAEHERDERHGESLRQGRDEEQPGQQGHG